MMEIRGDDWQAASLDFCTEPCVEISNSPRHSAETLQTSDSISLSYWIQKVGRGLTQTNTGRKEEKEACFIWGEYVTELVNSRQEDITMCSFSNTTLNCNNVPRGQTYWVSFEEKSFSRGEHFKAYSGRINGDGVRSGDWCVVKVFTRRAGTQKMCAREVEKCQKAKILAKEFNTWLPTEETRVKFSYLFWAQMDEVSWVKQVFFSGKRKLSVKDMVLIEDDLRYDEDRPGKKSGLTLYMDNLGEKHTCIAKCLEAFAHFTYHHSAGQLVVCDLEGVQDHEGFYLKTPVIHSREKKYGKSDEGLPAIIEVFNNHVCNDLCQDLIKPCELLHNFHHALNLDNRQDAHSASTVSCSNHHKCPEYGQVASHTCPAYGQVGSHMCPAYGQVVSHTCPAYEHAVSQDSCNNNYFLPQSPHSWSPSCGHSGSDVEGYRSFCCSDVMSGHMVEPSAPPEEDCVYECSPSCVPQTRHNFVANWILQEQAPNNFITSRSSHPSQHAALCGSLSSNITVGQMMPCMPPRTDSNFGNSSMPGPCCKCPTDNHSASDTRGDLCNNEHASASLSTGFCSSPSSCTHFSGNNIMTTSTASRKCNNSHFPSPLTQNAAISLGYTDSQIVDSCGWPNMNAADKTSTVLGMATDQHVCSNYAHHLTDSPPPYIQSQ